jgi:hypothetical protein
MFDSFKTNLRIESDVMPFPQWRMKTRALRDYFFRSHKPQATDDCSE